MTESILEKMACFDTLMGVVVNALSITFKDDVMVDKDKMEMSWEDYDYLHLDIGVKYENTHIDGVLIFGDGTIEFHEKETEEANNWADYPIHIIHNVIDNIKEQMLYGKETL